MSEISILSTKSLKPNQRDLLLGAGFKLVAYDAIEISFLSFEIPKVIENAIFTSQNGVRSFLKNIFEAKPVEYQVAFQKALGNIKVFCVGQKTKALLEENRLKATETAKNAQELGEIIIKNYKNNTFYFFCGNLRRTELPEILKNNNISFSEVKTYKTELKPKKFDQKWDGILFFSPSAVQSYISENKNTNAIAFCIGDTTAANANKYFNEVIVSKSNSVESVIAKAVKVLK